MEEYLKENIKTWLHLAVSFGALLVTVLILFFSWNLTTEFYEIPKFLVLSIFVGLVFTLTVIKFIVDGKITLNFTPLDLPLFLLVLVAIVSTYLAVSPYMPIVGQVVKVSSGLAAIITLVAFYYLLTNNLTKLRDIKLIIFLLSTSTSILAILSLLSYWGIKFLPLPWTGGLNFTPTGSSFNTTALLALMLPFHLLNIIKSPNHSLRLFSTFAVTLSGVTLVLIGSLPTIFAALVAIVFSVIIANPRLHRNLAYLLIPVILVALVGVLSFIPPYKAAKNPFYERARNFPREVTLDFATSWKVSASAFRDNPFWGTGPGTFIYNFTQYKPLAFNSSKFWNIRFDTSFNEYLGVLGTLGGFGFLLLLIVTISQIRSSLSVLKTPDFSLDNLNQGLAISGIVFFALLALHSATLVIWTVGLLLLALFYIKNSDLMRQFSVKLSALPAAILIILVILAFTSAIFISRTAVADFHHRKALVAVAGNKGRDAYDELVAAEKFNPYIDLYRTDLAQTNFALATAIATQKKESLSEIDKTNISQLLSQAITESRIATALNPRNPTNWEVLGSIYRNISGVAENALQFSLDSYGKAIQRDPLNPNLRLIVGGIYYSTKDYESAIRFFADAINLKPDFANGYYNLSVALRDSGDLSRAQATAEKLVSILKPESADYKAATDYLSDLKARIATGSAQESKIKAPAGESQGILEQKNLPQVLDLPTPDNLATPPAVKQP